MNKEYELAVIFKDDENSSAEGLNFVKDLLSKSNISILNEDVWGSRELAYPIEKHKKGYYVFIKMEGEPLTVKKIERDLRLNNSILRFLIFKKAKKKGGK